MFIESFRQFIFIESKIKYINRKLCSSIFHDWGKTWENIDEVVDNFDLPIIGKTKDSAMKAYEKEDFLKLKSRNYISIYIAKFLNYI